MFFRIAVSLVLFLGISPQAFARGRFSEERIPIALPSGKEVDLRIRIPSEAPSEKLPALAVFGGFQEAGKVLDLIDPPEPVVLASFDYPFEGERRFRFPSGLKLLPRMKGTIVDTLRGVPLALRVLAAHRRVDPTRITLLGASVGAPFALVGASESEFARGLVLIHGFGQVPETIEAQLRHFWFREGSSVPGFLAGPISWLLSRGAWIYLGEDSPENRALNLKPEQKIFVVDASDDSFIPAPAREAQWLALKNSPAGSVDRLILPGDHLQPGAQDLIRTIMARVVEWMAKAGLLASTQS